MRESKLTERCATCHHARQVGDKDRQDVVACVRMSYPDMRPSEVQNSNLYEGYAYLNRKVGDIGEAGRGNVARGCLTLSVITDSVGWCKHWRKFDW